VRVKLEALKETRSFYKWELKKKGLTEKKMKTVGDAINEIRKREGIRK